MEIDFFKLKQDLKDYYGTLMTIFPMAVIKLSQVEEVSPYELIEIARKNNFDLTKYLVINKEKEK